MANDRKELQVAAAKIGIGTFHRHVFLCVGPSCCSSDAGQAAWKVLKQLLKDKDVAACCRTKADCLRICCNGPTMVVYPEGTWYHGMTAERMPRFVQEHLIEGRPIREWIFAEHPLTAK